MRLAPYLTPGRLDQGEFCTYPFVLYTCCVMFHPHPPQISVAVSLLGEVKESFPTSVVQRFQFIPFPPNIEVIATNPRIYQHQSGSMLQISLELFVSWIHPEIEVHIRNFEIYISYSEDDYLCTYDLSSQSAKTMVCTYTYISCICVNSIGSLVVHSCIYCGLC